ncbi:MAG: hypothetical protein O2857_19890 [Planctomycetota bacterium]|nr:hypothetical protein [Planctomycetota bacterium]
MVEVWKSAEVDGAVPFGTAMHELSQREHNQHAEDDLDFLEFLLVKVCMSFMC